MKASIAYKTLDNITVVFLAFKNFKIALQKYLEQASLAGSTNNLLPADMSEQTPNRESG